MKDKKDVEVTVNVSYDEYKDLVEFRDNIRKDKTLGVHWDYHLPFSVNNIIEVINADQILSEAINKANDAQREINDIKRDLIEIRNMTVREFRKYKKK